MQPLDKKKIKPLPIQTPPVIVIQDEVILPRDIGPIYDQGSQLLGVPEIHGIVYQCKGEGETLCVIDDGYEPHENLSIPIDVKAYGYIETTSTSFHGPQVAGVAVGMQGNEVIAVAPNSKYALKKALGTAGGSPIDINDSVRSAVNEGYTNINMSLGTRGDYSHKPTDDTLKWAYEQGVTITVASGNEYDNRVGWPAKNPYVLAIGAIQFDDNHAPFSNSGKEIDFVSYGHHVIVVKWGGGHMKNSGTSYAAPIGHGCILLTQQQFKRLFGYRPTARENFDITEVYARDLASLGFDVHTGKGLITLDGIRDNFERYIVDFGRTDLRNYKKKPVDNDPEWNEAPKEPDAIIDEPVKKNSCDQKKGFWKWLCKIFKG